MQIEMFVGLVIPDNVATTANHTLHKIGYKLQLNREDYYKFTMDKDITEELGKVDLIVNANKHRYTTKKPDQEFENLDTKDTFAIRVVVKDIPNPGTSLLSILRDRLGFTSISDIEVGTLWTLFIKEKSRQQAITVAEDITTNLLANINYQEYSIY